MTASPKEKYRENSTKEAAILAAKARGRNGLRVASGLRNEDAVLDDIDNIAGLLAGGPASGGNPGVSRSVCQNTPFA
jgi:hypothetical protein